MLCNNHWPDLAICYSVLFAALGSWPYILRATALCSALVRTPPDFILTLGSSSFWALD